MSGILASIASLGVGELAKGIGSLAKDIRTAITGDMSPEQKERIQASLVDLEVSAKQQESRVAELQHNVIVAEAQGESWLQRNWRPVTMLTFTGLVVARWLGVTDTIDQTLELELMGIIKLGLGGFVIGRSAEKVVRTWKEKE